MIKKSILLITILIFSKVESQDSTLAIADSLYNLANYTQAINEYAKTPSTYTSWQIARSYNAIGNYDKAILQYEDLLKEDNSMLLAFYELGKLYFKIKSLENAEKTFKLLIQRDVNNPQYHYYLGLIMQKQNKDEKEILNVFLTAIKIDDTHLKSLYEISEYYVTKRKKDSVVKYTNQGLSFYPNSIELINLKAIGLFNNRDYRESIPLFEKLLELKQKREYIYEKLGLSYTAIEDYEKAIAAYNIALNFDDENPKTLNALGHIYRKLEEYDKAIEFINKAIEAQKVSLEQEYSAIARVYLDNRNIKKALEYYKLSFQENDTNLFVYYQICFLADNYYKDPKVRLQYFEDFKERFGDQKKIYNKYVEKRISELKAEIHLSDK